MSSILGITGFNRQQSAISKLLAAFGNDIVDVATGLGYSLNLNTSNNVEFETFLDHVFYQNYSETSKAFTGTVWTQKHTGRTMLAKYIKAYKSRLYLGNCKFDGPQAPLDTSGNAITFPSHVFKSDLFPIGNGNLTWGIEWGQNGSIIPGSNIFQLNPSYAPLIQDFVARNIKVGDQLFITSENGGQPNADVTTTPYTVIGIPSAYRLLVDGNFPPQAQSNGYHFWVSSNFFPVETNDNDAITGFGENSDNLNIYKLFSLSIFNNSQLRKSQNALGTPSKRSIINKNGYTYYFHGSQPELSGIYRFDGVGSTLVSRGIDPFIRGMSTTNYSSVVGWVEGNNLRFFLGDLTNTNEDISMTNAVATLNTATNNWSVESIADVITASTVWRTNNRQDSYTGTSDNQVLKMNSGNDHNGTPIRMRLETKVIYPTGDESLNEMTRVQIIAKNANGLRVGYKLWDQPKLVDDNFNYIGQVDGDKTELIIPKDHQRGSGISLIFDDYNILENDAFVEKATIFYIPEMTRMSKEEA